MFSRFYHFLVFCSGCDPDILDECPKSEKVKFSSIGATVLFTGILACLSGGYALHTIFEGIPFSIMFSILFGLLWGGIIFNIDRYLVSSLKKQGNVKRELWLAAPRFLMAIIISLVVSKPLEVRIFQDRIATQIYENKNNAALKTKKKLDTIFNQTLLGDKLSQEEASLENLQEKKDKGDPETPQFKELLSNLKTAKNDLETTKNVDSRRIDELSQNINNILKKRTIYDQNNIPKLPPAAESEIQLLRDRKRELSNEINSKASRVITLQNLINSQREAYQTEISERIAKTKKIESRVEINKQTSDSLSNIEATKGDTTRSISFKNTFVTQMEALGDLTDKWFSTMWWTSILISALILLIEISPIVAKLLSDRGPYDEKIQTRDLKISEYEKAERKIDIHLAEGIYLSDNILLRKIEHYTNTANESTETLLEFVNTNHNQGIEFDQLIASMDENIKKINDPKLKANYISNQMSFINIYDNFRNKIFTLYRNVMGEKDDH